MHDKAESIEDIDFLESSVDIDYSRSLILGYLKITSKEEKRLDLVAKQIYGQHGFMEQIMEFNGILNANDIIEDDVIIIPDIASMEDNLDVENYQNKFIESNKTSFSFDGSIIIGGQSKTPNRKISSKRNFRVSVKNGTVVL